MTASKSQLIESTADKLAAWNRSEARRSDRPLAAGDLLVFSAAGTAELQWLVLSAERHAEAASTLTLAPADTEPMLGPNDLEVREVATATPLHLRLSSCARVSEAIGVDGQRTGSISANDLERALGMSRQVGTAAVDEAALDLDYRLWIERMVEPAVVRLENDATAQPEFGRVAAFVAPGDQQITSGSDATVEGLEQEGSRVWGTWLQWAGIAASLLLIASMAVSGRLAWKNQKLSQWLSAERQAADARESAFLMGESRIDELLGRSAPVVFLSSSSDSDGERATVERPTVERIALRHPYFVLCLTVSSEMDTYRVELFDLQRRQVAWTATDVEAVNDEDGLHLNLVLSTSAFSPGRYEVRVELERDAAVDRELTGLIELYHQRDE